MSESPRNLLYKQFRGNAASHGLDRIAFPIYWQGRRDRQVEAIFLESSLRIKITETIVSELDQIHPNYYMNLQSERHRPYSKTCAQKVRESVGKTISLNIYATGVRVAIDMPQRTAPNVNVYKQFHVVPEELLPYVTEKQLEQLDAQGKRRHKSIRFTEFEASLFPVSTQVTKRIAPMPRKTEEEANSEVGAAESVWEQNRNVIFFGPPGTGKSYKVKEIVSGFLGITADNSIRVTFHPEFSYFDLVGSFRPVVGWLKSVGSFEDADGINRNMEPRTYYRFEPGPLSRALKLAAEKPNESIVLIIEEINRGNCAGIFGDIFQLLDRVKSSADSSLIGWSEYGIQPNSEWCGWLDREIPVSSRVYDHKRRVLRLPANLYLYATMNTSDQSLFPMDTAFRRRWGMSYVGIEDYDDQNAKVPIHANDIIGVPWTKLMHELNKVIVAYTRTDDKQMGPWFVRKRSNSAFVDVVEFKSKVLFYLWADVFRDETSLVFDPALNTYEEVLSAYNSGKQVFSQRIIDKIKMLGETPVMSEESGKSGINAE